ncbi:hypothetical protein BDZ97DRAFT_1838559 [Flammula alnicola]|nr:hypothetical protein BDZ97DRAFT_1838559 [Flammula alnicola]
MDVPRPRRSIRFTLDDVTIERQASDSENVGDDSPLDLTDPGTRLTVSPTHSQSSTSSNSGPLTPPPSIPILIDCKSNVTSESGDHPVIHHSLSMEGSFFWDMARTPDNLKVLLEDGDEPAVTSSLSQEPVSQFTLALDGIYNWKIEVTPQHQDFPSVRDTLTHIYVNLAKFVARGDAERLEYSLKRRVYEARENRCRDIVLDVSEEPLRRVDYLCGFRRFLGISPFVDAGDFRLNVGTLPSRD